MLTGRFLFVDTNIIIKINIFIEFISHKIIIIMRLATKNIFNFANISFIGLGNMGFPMAINLAKKGHTVFAYDIDASKAVEASKNNITFRKTIKELTKDADIFVTMLPNS
jgi:ketol-acid reductoisomerase